MNEYTQATNDTATTVLRDGFDARLVLSYASKCRTIPRSIHVLDMGCGRGHDVMNSAMVQADVLFTGVDTNASVLEEARQEAKQRGLTNVSFEVVHFGSTPKSSLEFSPGFEVPTGGFDVIHLHGNPNPGMGLQELLSAVSPLLARHGLLSVNMPARRAHYALVSEAIEGVIERSASLRERLEAARDHIDRMAQEEPKCADWRRASLVDDAEFVDSYMQGTQDHVDVAHLWNTIEACDLSFIRWHDASAWSIEGLGLSTSELAYARELPQVEQFLAVEEARNPRGLSLVLGHSANSPRPRFDLTQAGEAHFMVHPEVTFQVNTRNFWGSTHTESLTVSRGNDEPVTVRPSPAQTALIALRDQSEPFSGLNLVEVMTAEGASLEEALLALHQLLSLELIYRPHEFDVAQFYASMLSQCAGSAEEHAEVIMTPSPAPEHDVLTPTTDATAPLRQTKLTEALEGARETNNS